MQTFKYGLELELPLRTIEGGIYHAENAFKALFELWQARGYNPIYDTTERGMLLGTQRQDGSGKIVAAYDCVSSNIEFAIGAFDSLEKLDAITKETYNDLVDILLKDNACTYNLSELPNEIVSIEEYNKQKLDKPMYIYMQDVRKYGHYIGLDGKTQISPSTGIAIKDAIKAVNLIIKLSPAFIALYANSPYEDGKYTGLAENRLDMWNREFATSLFAQDYEVCAIPQNFFTSWQDYFQWLYGRNIPPFAFCLDKNKDLKSNYDLYSVHQSRNLIEYLKKDSWEGQSVRDTNKTYTIQPHIKDVLQQQFFLFIDARARFSFDPNKTNIKEFLHAFENTKEYFEDYLNELFDYSYIENRVPGSCSPDNYLQNNAKAHVPASVHMSSNALQAGILRNIEEIEEYLESIEYSYDKYILFKKSAIKNALQGQVSDIKLHDFVSSIVKIASKGLEEHEKKYLSYIEYLLDTCESGSDTTRKLIQKHTNSSQIDWNAVLQEKRAIKY